MNDVWSMSQQLPQDSHRKPKGQQQCRGLIVGQIEAQNIDNLHSMSMINASLG